MIGMKYIKAILGRRVEEKVYRREEKGTDKHTHNNMVLKKRD